MEIINNISKIDNIFVLTIGNFDGIHPGHQALIKRVVEISKVHDYIPSLMTFNQCLRNYLTTKIFCNHE